MANDFGQNVTFVPFHHVLQFPEVVGNIKTGVDNAGPSTVVKSIHIQHKGIRYVQYRRWIIKTTK